MLLYCNSPFSLSPGPSKYSTNTATCFNSQALECSPHKMPVSGKFVSNLGKFALIHIGYIYPVYNFDTFQGCAARNCTRTSELGRRPLWLSSLAVINKYIYCVCIYIYIYVYVFLCAIFGKQMKMSTKTQIKHPRYNRLLVSGRLFFWCCL